LPTLNFSLSDPDFALLFNKDGSPQKQAGEASVNQQDKLQTPSTGDSSLGSSTATIKARGKPVAELETSDPPRSLKTSGSVSLPTSPVALSPTPPHWQETIGKAALQLDGSESSHDHDEREDVIPSSTRFAMDRHDSSESSSSAANHHHGAPESALHVLQELLTGNAGSGKGEIILNVAVVRNVVQEIVHLRDTVGALKSKYMGAKVSIPHLSEPSPV
jgi:hypothetical protein